MRGMKEAHNPDLATRLVHHAYTPPADGYGVTSYPAAGFIHPAGAWAAR